jgi:hypothetical protein
MMMWYARITGETLAPIVCKWARRLVLSLPFSPPSSNDADDDDNDDDENAAGDDGYNVTASSSADVLFSAI